jgi:ketosteroid isomerase-like protein
MRTLSKDLEHWLDRFAQAVRDRDFAAAAKLFDRRIIAFGTVCSRANGLRALLSKQWSAVWPNTRRFAFDHRAARVFRQGGQAVVLAGWSSIGMGRSGSRFRRRGRATLVLRQTASGWKAVHTHFSLNPQNDSLLRAAA